MLITVARYRAITGDSTTVTSAVSALVEEAEGLLVEALERDLAEATRTELLEPTRDGYLWPSCTPITAATGWTINGNGLIGTFGPGWPDQTGRVSTTYTGGWVERTANPTATNRLPAYMERDIAFAAYALGHNTAAATPIYPVGATSVRLGDAAVTFGPDGAPRPGTDVVTWSRRTLSWRNRTVRSI